MIFAWFATLAVPALAVVLGAWLVVHLDPGRATAFDRVPLLLVQYVLAAAPLAGLALFLFVRDAVPGAIGRAVVVTGLATLAAWGWYHAGAPGATPTAAGFFLLASPVALGVLGVLVYQRSASRTR